MEADEIQCKFPRISDANGRLDDQYPDEEDDGENRRVSSKGGGGVDLGDGIARGFYGWPSSRIVRVSRASGGKDRHSKVLTSKGLRDRRVRLSVNTAIEFYDLQDRLGYDQPSKAVEWLLKAAASSIAELPPMSSPFPDTPKQSSTAGSDQLGFDSAEADPNGSQPQVTTNTKSSACSSTSETSKGSGLSLSRSESRMKARKRAKERVAAEKDKEKETESASVLNPISQTTSFTELLSGGINNAMSNSTAVAATTTGPNGTVHQNHGGGSNESNFFLISPRQWAPVTPMDYFNSGLLGHRPGQVHMSTNAFTTSPVFNVGGEHHPELLQFSFVPDHLVNSGGNINNEHNAVGNITEYNLNFRISSSSSSGNPSSSCLAAGFNSIRGTLQSNSTCSPSLSMPHLQRFPGGSTPNPPSVFMSPAADSHNHHPFLSGLQLCHGGDGNNGNRHSAGQKGKGKN